MVNVIIVGIVVVAMGFVIYSAIKHFKGQGGCCGGGGYRPKRKRLLSTRKICIAVSKENAR